MKIAGFLFAGLLAGFVSGGLGVGGAIIATPLVRALGLSPYLAIGTTVPSILPSTLTGAFTYWRQGLVRKDTVLWVAVPAAMTSVAGALATRRIDGHILMVITAALLFILALSVLRTKPKVGTPGTSPSVLAYSLLGLTSGFMSGLLGVGGGFLMVPVFLRTFGFPPKEALGTSLAIISVTVVPNLAAQAYVGNIDWRVAGLLTVGVIPGARLGALCAIKAPDRRLRRIVAISLAAMAAAYAAFEVAALS